MLTIEHDTARYGMPERPGMPGVDSGPASVAVSEREQAATALFRQVAFMRRAEQATGMVDDSNYCLQTLSTFAGSRKAIWQHLDPACVKLRSRSICRTKWRTPGMCPVGGTARPVDTFSRPGRSRICPSCVESHPDSAQVLGVALLHRAMLALAELAGEFSDHTAGRPALLAMREHLRQAEKLCAGFDLAGIVLPGTFRQTIDDALALARRTLADDSDRTESEVVGFLPAQELKQLAAASAAQPCGPYRLSPNPKGRMLEALVDDTGVRTLYFTSGLFGEWVVAQAASDVSVLWGRDKASAVVASEEPLSRTLSQAARWVVEPDLSLSPWDLTLANWRELAASELELLFGDWVKHYELVMSAPEAACWLLVHDPRPEKLAKLDSLDRFDLLHTVASRFPARELPTDGFFALKVPVAVARALSGFTSEPGVQAISLEEVSDELVAAVAEMASKLGGEDRTGSWLEAAGASAVAVLS